MKRAANILFLVGGIISIAVGVSLLITAVVFIALGASPAFKDLIIESINSGQATTTMSSAEEAAAFIQLSFIISGACIFIPTLCCIPSAIFSFKARNSDSHSLFILNIVFGILSGVEVNVVGAVFALIKGDTIEEHHQEPETREE